MQGRFGLIGANSTLLNCYRSTRYPIIAQLDEQSFIPQMEFLPTRNSWRHWKQTIAERNINKQFMLQIMHQHHSRHEWEELFDLCLLIARLFNWNHIEFIWHFIEMRKGILHVSVDEIKAQAPQIKTFFLCSHQTVKFMEVLSQSYWNAISSIYVTAQLVREKLNQWKWNVYYQLKGISCHVYNPLICCIDNKANNFQWQVKAGKVFIFLINRYWQLKGFPSYWKVLRWNVEKWRICETFELCKKILFMKLSSSPINQI